MLAAIIATADVLQQLVAGQLTEAGDGARTATQQESEGKPMGRAVNVPQRERQKAVAMGG